MKTYTCEIKTYNTKGDIINKRDITFEAEDGARKLRGDIIKYQNMGLKYNAELRQISETAFRLIYTERKDA